MTNTDTVGPDAPAAHPPRPYSFALLATFAQLACAKADVEPQITSIEVSRFADPRWVVYIHARQSRLNPPVDALTVADADTILDFLAADRRSTNEHTIDGDRRPFAVRTGYLPTAGDDDTPVRVEIYVKGRIL